MPNLFPGLIIECEVTRTKDATHFSYCKHKRKDVLKQLIIKLKKKKNQG